MDGYVIRWRNPRRQVIELNAESGLPQTLRAASDHAVAICNQWVTPVTVIENGMLVAVVEPDGSPVVTHKRLGA